MFIVPINVLGLASSASSAIVVDCDSDAVFYEKNPDDRRLIASITKIMTAVVAIENANLDDIVTVGEEVLSMYGSNIYIELGEHMTLRNLLYGLLLRSGNDSAIVIATYVGKSEESFVQMMNDKAQELGMVNTIFNNSHGLDEITQNYSTASDMAKLSCHAMTLSDYREISSTKFWRLQGETKSYSWENRNKLLKLYDYSTGGKTGYTPKAGRTLVTTASKNNLNLSAVTLNDPNEYVSHENMYEYVFKNYEKYLVIDKNNFRVDKTFYDEDIYVKRSFYYPLTIKEAEDISILAMLYEMKNYKNDDVVGEVEVRLNNNVLYKNNIYVRLEEEEEGLWNSIVKFFKRLFGGSDD